MKNKILGTMGETEIRIRIHTDIQIILDRYINGLCIEYDRIRRENKIDKRLEFPMCFDIITPSKNNWIVILRKASSDESYKGLYSIIYGYLFYYLDDNGIKVYKLSPEGISVYTTKLFHTYYENMNLKLGNLMHIVKHYFINNFNSLERVRENGLNMSVLALVRNGLILGDIIGDSCFIIFHTFIKKDMQNAEQTEVCKSLKISLQESIENEISKKDFNKGKYLYMADLYKSLS